MPKPARSILRIDSPQPWETLVAVPIPSTTQYFLAVEGFTHGPAQLVASLLDQDPTASPANVYPGKVLQKGKHWIISFTIPAVPKNFFLTVGLVADSNKLSGAKVTVPFRAALSATSAAAAASSGAIVITPTLGSDIPISCPIPNDVLCPQFSAYGSLFNNQPTNGATMQATNGDTSNGSLVTGLPPGVWMYHFENVPEGTGYTFTVTDVANKQGTCSPLSVDSTSCGTGGGPGSGSVPPP
jgi:hypothetical protein